MKQLLLACLAVLVVTGCSTPGAPPNRNCFHSSEAVETEIGYCQAVRIGNTLYISGTAGQGDMAAAMHSVYGRLQKTLEANGLAFADVVKENVYATDLDSFILNKDLRKEFYGKNLPAATWVQVQRLYVQSFVVEIELTAVYRQ
jgi:enamine deaminase RidA (YjgF/YER057c/UK114 family)